MTLQLSSGQGPVECERAVWLLLEALIEEYPDVSVKSTVPGSRKDCIKSVLIESEQDLSNLEGTVLWICQSPYRTSHKRKNWYVDISVTGKAKYNEFDDLQVKFQTFRCSGKGGQHVNKVETGVRAIYLPLGISVEATEARSQQLNKKLALDRLCAMIAGMNRQSARDLERYNRLEHTRLERGNPVRVYEGTGFIRSR